MEIGQNKVAGNQYIQDGQHNVMTFGDHNVVNVGEREAQRQPPGTEDRRVILVLAANPFGTGSLRLDEEQRCIDHAIQDGQFRDRLVVQVAPAVRTGDFQQSLMRYRPTIVHFSGHGAGRDGIVVSDDRGWRRRVPPEALRGLFGITAVRESIQCVVLNACHTRDQAAAIAAYVPCVVGMDDSVSDQAAIAFAGGFYRAIAFGHSVRSAFDVGCHAITLEDHDEADIPVLIATAGVAEKTIIAA